MIQSQRTGVLAAFLAPVALGSLVVTSLVGAEAILPGTTALTTKQPLDEVMVDGINRFCVRELAASPERRRDLWTRNYSTVEAYAASIVANRNRFQQIIGAVDPRVTSRSKRYRFELLSSLEQSSILARSDAVTVHAVR